MDDRALGWGADWFAVDVGSPNEVVM